MESSRLVFGYGSRVLVLLIAALVPVTALATAWILDVANRERERLERAVQTNTEAIVSRLDGAIAGHISALQALAASPLIDSEGMESFRRQLARAREHQPLWRNVLLCDRDHVQVLNLNRPGAREPVVPESHDKVFATGQPRLTPVSTGDLSGDRTVSVLVPVMRDGEARYILTAVLDLAALARSLREVLPPNWRAIIADQNQRIILRTSDGDSLTGELISEPARDALAAGLERQIRQSMSLTGEQFVAMYIRSSIAEWTVHAGFPVAELSVLHANSLQLAAAGGGVSLLLAVLLAYLLFRELRASRLQATALAEAQHLEALGRLAGGIAHDFNNLLMIMQGAASGIQRRADDPRRVIQYAESVLAAVRRGAALTRQLLSYARNERHSPVSFDLRDRAADLRTLLAQSTRGDIEISLSIAPDIWPIYADPNALEVALINLATNARDAMPDGGSLAVTAANVSLRPGDDAETGLAGDFVAITVADTGSGIEPDHLSRIFQPFFTTKEPGKGTGLGLSQVYGFARQSGGTLIVSSVVGLGTAFTTYLPRSREPAVAAHREAEAPSSPAIGRVLLVEDNPDVAGAIATMLSAAGLDFVVAADAEVALERLRSDRALDVVLSDIVLGGGASGLELETLVRTVRPDTPVVLMTGYSDSLAAGAARGRHVLAKPFRQEELIAALKAVRAERREVA